MDRKKMILVPASAGLLALALFGATAAYADSTPPRQDNAIQSQDATAEAGETAAEQPESGEAAAEKVEAGEPALPGGGHADADGQNVDNQFEGIQ